MTITDTLHQAVLKIPKKAWTPAYDAGGTERPGAWVAEITDIPDLSSWPKGMRLIVRKERPHPGAQLRFTDLCGVGSSGPGGFRASGKPHPRGSR